VNQNRFEQGRVFEQRVGAVWRRRGFFTFDASAYGTSGSFMGEGGASIFLPDFLVCHPVERSCYWLEVKSQSGTFMRCGEPTLGVKRAAFHGYQRVQEITGIQVQMAICDAGDDVFYCGSVDQWAQRAIATQRKDWIDFSLRGVWCMRLPEAP